MQVPPATCTSHVNSTTARTSICIECSFNCSSSLNISKWASNYSNRTTQTINTFIAKHRPFLRQQLPSTILAFLSKFRMWFVTNPWWKIHYFGPWRLATTKSVWATDALQDLYHWSHSLWMYWRDIQFVSILMLHCCTYIYIYIPTSSTTRGGDIYIYIYLPVVPHEAVIYIYIPTSNTTQGTYQ